MPSRRRQGREPAPEIKHLKAQLDEARAVIAALVSGQVDDLPGSASPLLLREARAALQASEERFRALVENGTDGTALVTADGRVVYVSPSITGILGYTPAEARGRRGLEFIHPEDRVPARTLASAAIAQPGAPLPSELRAQHKDGSWRDLEFVVVNRLDDPSVAAMVASFRDITRRKEAEASHRRLAAIIESSEDAIIGKSLAGVITSWNRGAERMYGYTPEEAIGRSITMIAPPDRRAEIPAILERLALGERISPYETVRIRKDGTRFHVSLTVSPILDRGRVVAASVIARDTTARRLADEARRASEERYRALMEQASDAILVCDPAGRILEANRRAEQILGRPRGELIGFSYDDLVPATERTDAAHNRERLLSEGALGALSRQVLRADGSRVPVEISGARIDVPEGPLVFAIMRDVTERTRTEEASRRAAEKLKSVLDGALDAVIGMDERGLISSWNARAEAIFGWTAQEAVGRVLAEVVIPIGQRQAHTAGLARFLATGEGSLIGRRVEVTALRRDGSTFPVELSVVAVVDAGTPTFTAFVADITERKAAQHRLAESEEQYRRLFDANPQPMWVFDEETLAFLAVNAAAVRHYGWSQAEFLGLKLTDVRAPDDVPLLLELLAEARRADALFHFGMSGVWRHLKKDGTLIDVEGGVSPIMFAGRRAWLALVSDVTERKKLEAQVLQSQKMDSIGRLAGGVAHDFNNILGVIVGCGDLLRRRLPDDPRTLKYVDDMQKAAQRGAGLTRQLLAFSRRQVLQPRILSLNGVAAEMEQMLRRLIGEDIHLVTVFDDRLASVRADAGQLEQVLMNLVVNARDAMPLGGRIIIETGTVWLDEDYAASHAGVVPGRYSMLAVSDTGQGMSPEVQSHLFEPFFTTKEKGKGTGLGLATVHGIVKQSGGHVFVYSEPGRGSAFKVYLPAVDEAPGKPEVVPVEEAHLTRGSETVLLVEDEAALRGILKERLEESGYVVLAAPDGIAALAVCAEHDGPIDLLLTDVVLPRMGGSELARRLAEPHPEMKVVYMSGYTDDAVILHGVLTEATLFLEKPFTASSLVRKLREALDQR